VWVTHTHAIRQLGWRAVAGGCFGVGSYNARWRRLTTNCEEQAADQMSKTAELQGKRWRMITGLSDESKFGTQPYELFTCLAIFKVIRKVY
jgi:hypothetical protein